MIRRIEGAEQAGEQVTDGVADADLSAFIRGLTEATTGFQMLNAGACAAEKAALVLKGVEHVRSLCETYSAMLRGRKNEMSSPDGRDMVIS